MEPRTDIRPRDLDLFFTSVSATTVSSMSTVEMEVFSNPQLVILTVLMFIGGVVFTSMVGLQFRKSQLKRLWRVKTNTSSARVEAIGSDQLDPPSIVEKTPDSENPESGNEVHSQSESSLDAEVSMKYNAIKFLGSMVLGYLLVVHVLGVALVSLHMTLVSSARNVLKNKGLNTTTFSIFTTVSTFASCGFIPTNENMIVFRKNPGLLLILIPQTLLGGTLFPSCLRLCIWFVGKFFKRTESNYLLKKTKRVGYFHLLPRQHSLRLVFTVFGFILIQLILFCAMEWNSIALLGGLNSYQKIIGIVFQTVNTRHTGETIMDISIISPAILVLFVVLMYLPPYTCFLPRNVDDLPKLHKKDKRKERKFWQNLLFSQVSYLVIFTVLICITERREMKEDPLNFSLLNIVIEVVSAYGNVGFSTGYSCERRLNPIGTCENKSYGFSGKWSDGGKVILIMTMFFGRLKRFSAHGGTAWKLL